MLKYGQKTFFGDMQMFLVFKQLFILYIFLFAGWVIGKRKKAVSGDILSVLIVNLLLPCKIFNTFANNFTVADFKEKYIFLPVSAVLLLILVIAAYFASKLITKHPYERKVYRYSFAISNYAYLGYALIEGVFGEEMLSNFIFFAIPFIIYTYTAGYAMLTGGKKPLKRLLNPITIAIVLGMICGMTSVKIPDVISSVTSMASACVGPLSMLLTGITLAAFSLKELFKNKQAYIFCGLRLILFPAVAYGVCTLFGLDALLPFILIITVMPCGLNTIVFPKLVGEDCKPGARLALISHLLSLITLPLWLSLIL